MSESSFSETFTAEPDPDYMFSGWQRRERGFCGGNAAPCSLSTVGFENSLVLAAVLEGDDEFFLTPTFKQRAWRGGSCSTSLSKTPVAERFSFKEFFTAADNAVGTLSAEIVSLSTDTGAIQINGGDTSAPASGFKVDWGDGTIDEGVFFPFFHQYADLTRDYTILVQASAENELSNTVRLSAYFIEEPIEYIANLDPDINVSIPEQVPVLGTVLYNPPTHLEPLPLESLGDIDRDDMEYLLSVAANIQAEALGCDVEVSGDRFEQEVYTDPEFENAASIWYTRPAGFVIGTGFLEGAFAHTVYWHEMGHNFTANYPASYRYGGRLDGNANAIYGETVAQIFQHVTAYEIINRASELGIPTKIRDEMENSALSAFRFNAQQYREYMEQGMPFASWNEGDTEEDETLMTFTTMAYKFVEYAEAEGIGFIVPLQRMMCALSVFDAGLQQRWSQNANTPEAELFRSTFMVSAMTYAFGDSVVEDFRQLGFPIDDETISALGARQVSACAVRSPRSGFPS
ncbi:MAG: hypothetical protein AAGI24_03915 [Pseudomonadota bacterium]